MEPQPLPQEPEPSAQRQEVHPAEDLIYEAAPTEDTAALGMVEVTIDSICGDDEDSPPR